MSLIAETPDIVLRHYGSAIGQPVAAVPTPALLLDLPAAWRNIQRMADGMAALPATLRPHVKAHKSPDLARLQAKAGARGFSTATVWEAAILVEAGVTGLLTVEVGTPMPCHLATRHSTSCWRLGAAEESGAAIRHPASADCLE